MKICPYCDKQILEYDWGNQCDNCDVFWQDGHIWVWSLLHNDWVKADGILIVVG